MRLRRLDLTRYGKFTDHSIDFGEPNDRTADLHIIYGPNEAGKSTTLAAYLDLLYRIEPQSRYRFLHPYSTMRIGAALQFGGKTHEFIRIKRDQNDLLDAGERPISESIIAGQLGGIDRAAYRSMFSLDDDTLEAGGKSILESQGELGQLLFSASTGLADLSRALVDLRAETDKFHKTRARGSELQALKLRLSELKDERARIDTAASGYAQLIDERDRAWAHYEQALAARTASQSRIDEIQRWLSVLPRLADLRDTRAKLAPLPDWPAPPAEWTDTLPKLQTAEITLAASMAAKEREIAQRVQEIETIVIDEPALKMADRVARLSKDFQSPIVLSRDIADRHREISEAEAIIVGILARIGRPNDPYPQRLTFNPAIAGSLHDLIAQRSGVERDTQNAAAELAKAEQMVAEAAAKLAEVEEGADNGPPPDTALQLLADALAWSQTNDQAFRCVLAERAHAKCTDDLADQLRALLPWQGEIDQLAQTQIPEADEIAQWKHELAAARNGFDQSAAEVERLKSECLRLQSERDAMTEVLGIVTDHDAGAIRATREAAWADHRRTLDAASADAFETTLRRDDIVMESRLRHEADIAKLHQTNLALALAEAAAQRTHALHETNTARLQQIQASIETAIAPLLPVNTTLTRFEAWLRKREKALASHAGQKQSERDLLDARADAEALRQRLTTALAGAGETPDPNATTDALRAAAQIRLNRESELKMLRATLKERQRELTLRQRNAVAAQQRDAAWQTAWRDACTQSWLHEIGTPPSLTTVQQILTIMPDLAKALETHTSLLLRIDGMRQDQQAYVDEVAAIARALDLSPNVAQPLDLTNTITARVQTAQNARSLHDELTRALNDARAKQAELRAAQADHETQKDRMTGFFNVTTLAEVAAILSDIETRADLSKRVAATEQEILHTLHLPSIQAAEELLDTTDRIALEQELTDLKARFADQDQRKQDLFAAHAKAADKVEAVGGDDAVARIDEQRRTIHLQIEDGAIRYLSLRAGTVAAEHALRSYRQQHRSSMMAHASDAFRTISRDAYRGLASQPNKDNEILIAVAADGSTKETRSLSKGTCFQLYLALRVAGYHEFAKSRAPVPFIADDIMETFDDFRAEETFRLLSLMARVGQVIYLTHHRHLCDIARHVCPGVHIHELPTGGSAELILPNAAQ